MGVEYNEDGVIKPLVVTGYDKVGCMKDDQYFATPKHVIEDMMQYSADKGLPEHSLVLNPEEHLTQGASGDLFRMATYNRGLIAETRVGESITSLGTVGGSIVGGPMVTIENNTTLKINPQIDSETYFVASGYANYSHMLKYPVPGGSSQYAVHNNPAFQAGWRAMANALLGILANKGFAGYLHAKGYVYKDSLSPGNGLLVIPEDVYDMHSSWSSAIIDLFHYGNIGHGDVSSGKFKLPSNGNYVESNCLYHANHACSKPFFSTNEVGEQNGKYLYVDKPVIVENPDGTANHASQGLQHYGTQYSPTFTQPAADHRSIYNLGVENYVQALVTAGTPEPNAALFASYYSPMDMGSVKPLWCNYWESLPVDFTFYNSMSDEPGFANHFTSYVPRYAAKLHVNIEGFVSFLEDIGLIVYNEFAAEMAIMTKLQVTNGVNTTGFGGTVGGKPGTFDDGLGKDGTAGGKIPIGTGQSGGGEGGLNELLGDAIDLLGSSTETKDFSSEVEKLSEMGDDDDSKEGASIAEAINSPFQQALINEAINEAITEINNFSIGPVFEGSTHYINDEVNKTMKNRMSIPNSVFSEYSKYDRNAEARIQKVRKYGKDNLTSFTLPYGTTVKVVDEFVQGNGGLYHKIQVTNPDNQKFGSKESFFIKAELLTKLDSTLPSLATFFKNYVKSEQKTEWIKMEDEEIFFDRNLLAYSIVVEPIDPNTGKKVSSMLQCTESVENLERQALRTGIIALLKCHNKAMFMGNDVETTVKHLIDGVFQFAYTGDNVDKTKKGLNWYLDPRPRSKVRFIVRIPAKYFDALSRKIETFEDLPHFQKKIFNGQGNQPIDSAPTPSDGLSDFRITSLLTCNIKHKIDLATSIMEKYRDQIAAWDGQVDGLDLDLEIERLRAFPNTIQKFVIDNHIGFRSNGEDELEIGCNSKFRLKYVSYVKAGLSKPLRICFNRFKRKSPVKYSRTMAYIYYLDDIVELEKKLTTGASNQQQMNWVEFVQKYTYPMPAIKPSSRKRTNALSPNALLDGKENKAEKMAEKLDKQVELTRVSLDAQRIELSKPEFKLDLASARLKHKDFSGDVFVEQIPQLVDSIRNLSPNFDGLQDLFSLVFDKIDISALSSIGAGSLAFDMPTIDVEGAFALAAIDSPDISGLQFDKIFDFLPEVEIGKIKKIESYFGGGLNIKDLEGEFPDDILNMVLEYYEKREEKPQPTGREADLMRNGSLEDIKCLGLDKKFGTSSPRLSESQNTRKELVKMVVSPNDLASAIRNVTPDIINAMSEIGELGKKDVPSLSLSPLKKAAVKFPKPPTLTLPKLPDIADTMPNISKDLTAGLEQVLATALLEVSATLLETVFNSVFSSADKLGQSGVDSFPSEFGGQNMNELLEDFNPGKESAVEDALKKLGIGPSTEDYDMAIDAIAEQLSSESEGGDVTAEETDKTSKQLINEISSVLTPLEVVDLLEGTPSSETIKVVESVMGEGNQSFLDTINRVTSVKELFKNLGTLVDSNKLEAIRNTVEEILPNASGLLCEYENFNSIGEPDSPGDVIRRRALEGKLDKECVESQMSEIRKRKTKRLANLLSLANGKDLLAGKVPPLIGSCGKGIINKNHQTVEHMNEKLINAIFNPIKMNFSTEANSIPAAYADGNVRPPDQYDDQYDALKAALGTAGIEGIETSKDVKPEFIADGFANTLEGGSEDAPSPDQQKFNNAAAPFYITDGTTAPKIRNLYSENISSVSNNIYKIKTKYTKVSKPEDMASADQQKKAVDNAIASLRSLEQKIALAPDGSDEKAILEGQKAQVISELGNREDTGWTTLYGIYNNAFQTQAEGSATDVKVETFVEANFEYTTKDTDVADEDKILDTWEITISPDLLKGSVALPPKATNTSYQIAGYREIDEIIPEEAENYILTPNLNERDQVFANMMKEKWESIIPSPEINFTTNSEFSKFYRGKRSKIFNYVINIFSNSIYNSKLFEGSGLQDLQLGSGKSDANFDVNAKCGTDKVDNILGIEDLKKQARDEYNNSCDEETDPSKPSGLEKANLRSLMRAAIRVSILDAVTRGIFVCSVYRMTELLSDDALTDFFVELVKGDLLSQDNEYYTEFLIQAKNITDEMQGRGEKILDPFTGVEDGKLLDPAHPNTNNGEHSLRFMIRQELKYLAPKIDEKVKPTQKWQTMDYLFIKNMIPHTNVRKHPEQNQYHDFVFESLTDEFTGEKIGNFASEIKVKAPFRFIVPGDGLSQSAGGFVLEKYVRISDAEISEDDLSKMTHVKKKFLEDFFSRPGGRYNETPKVIEAAKIDIGLENQQPYGYTSGAVNIDALVHYIRKFLEGSSIESIKIEDMFSEFKFGLRLVYVPPASEITFAGTVQSYNSENMDLFDPFWKSDSIVNNGNYISELKEVFDETDVDDLLEKSSYNKVLKDIESADGDQAKEDAITLAANKEKLFRIREKLGTFQNNLEFDEADDEGEKNKISGDFSQNVHIKELHPIELAKVEGEYGFLDVLKGQSGKINLEDLCTALEDQAVLTGIKEALINKLVKDEKFKFLFHYDIPLKRALSLIFMHQNMSSIKNYPAVGRSYAITKNMLRSSFFNMIPGDPWWSKQDKRIEEQGGNAGMMETANNTMTADGPSGSDMAMKIAYMAASIICKAMAAQQDPHYGTMKMLDTFGLTPAGMNWGSVPMLYPVNFPLPFPPFFGWGPPMTPLGMVAYSLPDLPGEAKKNKKENQETEC